MLVLRISTLWIESELAGFLSVSIFYEIPIFILFLSSFVKLFL